MAMKTNFMIHFSDEGAVFRSLYSDRVWLEVGQINHNENWHHAKLDVIRNRAIRLGGGGISTTVLVYPELIKYTELAKISDEKSAMIAAIRQHLAMMTGKDTKQLVYDWICDGQSLRVAYAEWDEIKKLTEFVTRHGFPVVSYAALQEQHQDFPSCIFLGVTEFGNQQGLTADDLQAAVALKIRTHDGPPNRPGFNTEDENSHIPGHRTTASLMAAACLALFLTLSAASLIVGFDSVMAAEGLDTEWVRNSQTQPVVPSGNNWIASSDPYRFMVIDGWQSAIGGQRSEQKKSNVRPISSDRGFDPGQLIFETLKLAPSIIPVGHDLKEWKNPVNTGGTKFIKSDRQPIIDEEDSEEAATNLVAEAADIAPLSKDKAVISEVAAGTTRIANEVETDELPLNLIRPVRRPSTGLSAKDQVIEFAGPRPVLRDGARDEPAILAYTRPILRDGARKGEAEVVVSVDDNSQDITNELVRTAILESLEADVEPQTPILTRPEQRPPVSVSIDESIGGPEAGTQTVSVRPLRRPTGSQQGEEIATLPATPISTDTLRSNALATVQNDFNLSAINLIGIYGSSGLLRALVRLPSGEFQNVYVGSAMDGGQVVEITNSTLTYVKGNEKLLLSLPN